MSLSKRLTNGGFTIIEIVLVIAIAGMLSVGAMMGLMGKVRIGQDARRKHDIESIRTALNQYYDSKECFPSTLGQCGSSLMLGQDTLLYSMPCDPSTNNTYKYEPEETSCPQSFEIYTNLENTSDSLIKLAGCEFGCGFKCKYNYGVTSPNIALDTCLPQYACSNGGGQSGQCILYKDPEAGECPITFPDDPTCANQCSDKSKRCKSNNGKN